MKNREGNGENWTRHESSNNEPPHLRNAQEEGVDGAGNEEQPCDSSSDCDSFNPNTRMQITVGLHRDHLNIECTPGFKSSVRAALKEGNWPR
jgi:hypothetical protein